LTHTLVAELYSSVPVRMGALQDVFYSRNRVMCDLASCRTARCDVGRGRETHRHNYTRLPAALSDELGGLSTWLGLFASPPLILSTELVVVMEWKGMSTAIQDKMRKRETGTAKPALLGPTSSDWGDTLTHTLVAEPDSSDQMRTGALQAVFYHVLLRKPRYVSSLAPCRMDARLT